MGIEMAKNSVTGSKGTRWSPVDASSSPINTKSITPQGGSKGPSGKVSGSPMKKTQDTASPMKKCHSSDAACLKRERQARRDKETARIAAGGKRMRPSQVNKGAKDKGKASEYYN